ncbi:MAG: hypothetical protein Q8P20_01810 [bacterium]|nr:hypothetical protein [bacterium]
MNERKSAIFGAIIKEHVTQGNTVASKVLVDKYDFKLSPATMRNEMVELEREGYIFQPHTSAGRIPTEKGWKYYIDNFIEIKPISRKHKEMLDNILQETGISFDTVVKKASKILAEISKDAVFVGFSPDDFYYTGLSHLFKNPEFQKLDLVHHISEVVDHLDEAITDMFEEVRESKEEKVLIGNDNPFGAECSTIITSYSNGKDIRGVFGILGPMRMNYEDNMALIKYAKELFNNV